MYASCYRQRAFLHSHYGKQIGSRGNTCWRQALKRRLRRPLHHKGIHLVSSPKQNLMSSVHHPLTKAPLLPYAPTNDMILAEIYFPKETNKSSVRMWSTSSLRICKPALNIKAGSAGWRGSRTAPSRLSEQPGGASCRALSV